MIGHPNRTSISPGNKAWIKKKKRLISPCILDLIKEYPWAEQKEFLSEKYGIVLPHGLTQREFEGF